MRIPRQPLQVTGTVVAGGVDDGGGLVFRTNCGHASKRGRVHLQADVSICKQTIYNHVHADPAGKLAEHTPHRLKYRR